MPSKSATSNATLHRDMVITVAAPVRDDDAHFVEAFVRETSAVLAERFAYYEVLLVDHGSGDGLIRLVEQV